MKENTEMQPQCLKTADDKASQTHITHELMKEISPMVRLLNGLTDERAQWQVASGKTDYLDLFGVIIPRGRRHYRQGSPLNDPIRLAADSMGRLLCAVFGSNQHGIDIAEASITKRLAELRAATNLIRSTSTD